MNKVSPASESLGIIAAGLEGMLHGIVLALTNEGIRNIVFLDTAAKQTKKAISEVRSILTREGIPQSRMGISGLPASKIDEIYACQTIITATYGQTPVIHSELLKEGTFIAAVGADLPNKQEINFPVYNEAKFVADDIGQCLREGELRHAAERIRFKVEDHGDYGYRGPVLDGLIVGVADLLDDPKSFLDRSTERVTIYDSTGFSGQDLALARVLLENLRKEKWPTVIWNPPEKVSLVKFFRSHSK
jgi:ornithine cyclodeaminase/alanine dehydrogenase